MNRLISLLVLIFLFSTAEAQLFKPREKRPVSKEHMAGAVSMENKRVVFRDTIATSGYNIAQTRERVLKWYNKRYNIPTVISSKIITDNARCFEAIAEEYITFKNKFFVLDRSRIYYYLTFNFDEKSCEVIISRISYWYDDENPDGGIRYNAEEIITDEHSIKNGRLKKEPGKFRTKTIDLKNEIFKEIKQEITSKP